MRHFLLLCFIATAAGMTTFNHALIRAGLLKAEKPQVRCGGVPPIDDSEPSRAAVANDYYLWEGGIIPYEIHPKLEKSSDPVEMDLVEKVKKAISEIERQTDYCVEFVKRDSTLHKDYIQIVRGEGCNSCVGRQHFSEIGYYIVGKNGLPQLVSLDYGCENLQIVMHELLHAIGLTHEHQRPDRDEHLIISKDCLGDNDPLKNYDVMYPNQVRCLTPFDMESIMLYGSEAFYGKSCVTDLDGNKLPEVYEKKGMSDDDVKRVKILYGCDGEKDTMSKKLCKQKPKKN